MKSKAPIKLDPAKHGLTSYDPSLYEDMAYWLARNWYGDDRQGVEDAKRLLDTTGVGALAVGANEATRSIRNNPSRPEEAALKFMAGVFPPLRAVHVSPKSFSKFNIQEAGRGLGSYEGPGLYFSPPDSPATPWYGDLMEHKNIVNKLTGRVMDKSDEHIEIYNDLFETIDNSGLFDAYEGMARERKVSVAADKALLKLFNPRSRELKFGTIGKDAEINALIDGLYMEADVKKPYKYESALHVGDPENLPRYDLPLSAQPVKHKPAIEKIAAKAFPAEKAIIKKEPFAANDEFPGGVLVEMKWPGMGVGQGFAAETPSQADLLIKDNLALNELKRQNKPMELIKQYFTQHAPEIYRAHDINAFQYPEYERVGKENIGKVMNTVMQNDELIEIIKKSQFGAAGAGIGAALMGQMGGDEAQAGEYDSELDPVEERHFQTWKQKNAPNDSGEDYDLRGAFIQGLRSGTDDHWPDTFKKPNHPTFSNESKYATGANKTKAGHWEGSKFIPSKKKKD